MTQSQHYAGVSFDAGQTLSSRARNRYLKTPYINVRGFSEKMWRKRYAKSLNYSNCIAKIDKIW